MPDAFRQIYWFTMLPRSLLCGSRHLLLVGVAEGMESNPDRSCPRGNENA